MAGINTRERLPHIKSHIGGFGPDNLFPESHQGLVIFIEGHRDQIRLKPLVLIRGDQSEQVQHAVGISPAPSCVNTGSPPVINRLLQAKISDRRDSGKSITGVSTGGYSAFTAFAMLPLSLMAV